MGRSGHGTTHIVVYIEVNVACYCGYIQNCMGHSGHGEKMVVFVSLHKKNDIFKRIQNPRPIEDSPLSIQYCFRPLKLLFNVILHVPCCKRDSCNEHLC